MDVACRCHSRGDAEGECDEGSRLRAMDVKEERSCCGMSGLMRGPT